MDLLAFHSTFFLQNSYSVSSRCIQHQSTKQGSNVSCKPILCVQVLYRCSLLWYVWPRAEQRSEFMSSVEMFHWGEEYSRGPSKRKTHWTLALMCNNVKDEDDVVYMTRDRELGWNKRCNSTRDGSMDDHYEKYINLRTNPCKLRCSTPSDVSISAHKGNCYMSQCITAVDLSTLSTK